MTEVQEGSDEFIDRFREQLSHVDEVTQVVLNGHLKVERQLDDVLKIIFLHPEYLQDLRLTFNHKTQIARAYAERGNDKAEWRLILILNALRNEIAHGGPGEKRTNKIGELRKLLSEKGSEKFRQHVGSINDKEVIVDAAAMCCGHLIILEDDLTALRRVTASSDDPDGSS